MISTFQRNTLASGATAAQFPVKELVVGSNPTSPAMKQKIWTKRCAKGDCAGLFGDPAFVADESELCDRCLLSEYMDDPWGRHDTADNYGMGPEYFKEEEVVKALRRATGR